MAAFSVAAATMVILIVSASVLLGRARQRAVDAAREHGPTVKRWGGGVMAAVGVWVTALGAFPGTFAPLLFPG